MYRTVGSQSRQDTSGNGSPHSPSQSHADSSNLPSPSPSDPSTHSPSYAPTRSSTASTYGRGTQAKTIDRLHCSYRCDCRCDPTNAHGEACDEFDVREDGNIAFRVRLSPSPQCSCSPGLDSTWCLHIACVLDHLRSQPTSRFYLPPVVALSDDVQMCTYEPYDAQYHFEYLHEQTDPNHSDDEGIV